jgi:WD40 repeat protein
MRSLAFIVAILSGALLVCAQTQSEFELSRFNSSVNSISVSSNAKILYAVSEREGFWAFELSKKQRVAYIDLSDFDPVSTAVSKDGRWVSITGLGICLVECATNKISHRIDLQNDEHVWASNFSADGKHLVFGGESKSVSVLDISKKKVVQVLKHNKNITSVACSPCNNWIAAGDTMGVLNVWSVRENYSMKITARTSSEMQPVISTLEFSPDSKSVVCANWSGQVIFLDLTERTRPLVLYNHEEGVTKVRFTKDGTKIISTGSDGKLNVYDRKKKTRIASLEVSQRSVESFDFIGSDRIAACSYDHANKRHTIQIYSVKKWMAP